MYAVKLRRQSMYNNSLWFDSQVSIYQSVSGTEKAAVQAIRSELSKTVFLFVTLPTYPMCLPQDVTLLYSLL